MPEKKIVILGAGLAGLSCAWHLERGAGCETHLFEKEDAAGGLCRSSRLKGFTFDRCGHLIHFKHPYTRRLMRTLTPGLLRHERKAWIFLDRRYVPYPFQAHLSSASERVYLECLQGFIDARNRHSASGTNFLAWITNTFGEGVARHFMVPYNRKFWRYDLSRMTCEWLEGFVPVPTVKQVLERSSSGTIGYNSTFFYPRKGGISVLADALAAGIKRVKAGSRAVRIDPAARKVYFSDGRCESYDALVSTIPLPELPRIIGRMDRQTAGAFAALRWNSIYNLNAGFSVPENGSRHWVYFPEKKFPFYRVGFFSSFSPDMAPEGKSSAYIEVSYDRKHPPDLGVLWKKAARGLVACGMIRSARDICLKDSLNIPYAYPIYDRRRPAALRVINSFLARHGISCCGRFGSWSYMTMEEAILDGKRCAEKIGV